MNPSSRPKPIAHRAAVACAALAADHVRQLAQGQRAGPKSRPPLAPSDAHVDANYAQQRAGVVQWLVHMNATNAAFTFSPETAWASVVYFDRVLATTRFATPQHYYLLAAVCLSLAAKHNEEYCAPSTRGVLSAFPKGTWTRRDALQMERDALQTLEYNLECVAPSQAALEVLLADPTLALGVCKAIEQAGQETEVVEVEASSEDEKSLPSPPVSPALLDTSDDELDLAASPTDSAISSSPAAPRAADLLCAANEHWPVSLRSPGVRATLVTLARHVQTAMLRRVALHALGTAHAPLSTGVVLLNRAVAAHATKHALSVAPEDVPVVTCPAQGSAVAPCGRAISAVPCMARNEQDASEFARCIGMVKASCEAQATR